MLTVVHRGSLFLSYRPDRVQLFYTSHGSVIPQEDLLQGVDLALGIGEGRYGFLQHEPHVIARQLCALEAIDTSLSIPPINPPVGLS